ncbi:MAG: hypothetical protein QM758_26320 [Armatimonas sp.]
MMPLAPQQSGDHGGGGKARLTLSVLVAPPDRPGAELDEVLPAV